MMDLVAFFATAGFIEWELYPAVAREPGNDWRLWIPLVESIESVATVLTVVSKFMARPAPVEILGRILDSFPRLYAKVTAENFAALFGGLPPELSAGTLSITTVTNFEVYPPKLALPPKNLTFNLSHQYLTAAYV
jgi:hypothetical protein